MKDLFGDIAERAIKRLKAVETGISVKERRQGQAGLFDGE